MTFRSEMIRVELGPQTKPGVWQFTVPSLRTGGKSSQPLLDACRLIKRMGGDLHVPVGLFNAGADEPRLVAKSVDAGARLSVSELKAGNGPSFVPYRQFGGGDDVEF